MVITRETMKQEVEAGSNSHPRCAWRHEYLSASGGFISKAPNLAPNRPIVITTLPWLSNVLAASGDGAATRL
jgi:hypothetical protein